MPNPPKFYRSYNKRISWEVYTCKHFFITICIGNLEIQINKWPNRGK